MTLEKQQGQQQFVQCFHLSMDDLKGMIKEAVKSVFLFRQLKLLKLLITIATILRLI